MRISLRTNAGVVGSSDAAVFASLSAAAFRRLSSFIFSLMPSSFSLCESTLMSVTGSVRVLRIRSIVCISFLYGFCHSCLRPDGVSGLKVPSSVALYVSITP